MDKEELLSGRKLEYKLLNSDAGLNRALTPNAWNYVDENMNFYFSTDTGVICMNLKNYEVSVRSYRMQMKSVKIDDVSHFVRRGEVIYLERGAEKLEIFPEIINYSVNIPYVSVYLEGYDSEPQVMSQSEMSSVIYTNLPVGTYKFHIAVLDHKGQKPVVESVYTIEKKAEIYDHWWFVVYIVAVFTLAVAYLTWMIFHTQVQRVINLQKKEIELVKKQLEMGNETVLTIAKTVDAKDVSRHRERVERRNRKALRWNVVEGDHAEPARNLHAPAPGVVKNLPGQFVVVADDGGDLLFQQLVELGFDRRVLPRFALELLEAVLLAELRVTALAVVVAVVVIAGHKAVEIADAAVSERVQVLHHEAHVGGFVAHDRAAGFAADAVDHDIRDSGLFDIPELARVDHVGHDQPRDFPLRHRVVEVPDRLAGNEVEGVVQLRQFARNHIDRVGDRVGLPQQVAVVEQKRNLAVLLVPQRTENAVRPVAAGFDLLENAFPQLRLHGEVLAAAQPFL